jgi:hypothetical protein
VFDLNQKRKNLLPRIFHEDEHLCRAFLANTLIRSSGYIREHKPAHSWARGGGYTDFVRGGGDASPGIELPDTDGDPNGKSGVEE